MSEIKNAKITGTMLGIEDHDILTFSLFIEGGGCACMVGGYSLDQCNRDNSRAYSAKVGELIRTILEVVGVYKWEDLKGKYIRYVYNGLGESVTKIGNITEDKWIDFKDFFRKE